MSDISEACDGLCEAVMNVYRRMDELGAFKKLEGMSETSAKLVSKLLYRIRDEDWTVAEITRDALVEHITKLEVELATRDTLRAQVKRAEAMVERLIDTRDKLFAMMIRGEFEEVEADEWHAVIDEYQASKKEMQK